MLLNLTIIEEEDGKLGLRVNGIPTPDIKELLDVMRIHIANHNDNLSTVEVIEETIEEQ